MSDISTPTPSSKPSLLASLPAVNVATIGLMFISGFVATMAFDTWGQIISPSLGWANLSPHGLAVSLLGSFDIASGGLRNFLGYVVHFYLVGLIAYPVGWLYIFKPLWAQFGPDMHWFVPSAIYGFGLWVFAIGGITTIAGLPFFLGFTGITWVALVGHVLYGIVMVAVMQLIAKK